MSQHTDAIVKLVQVAADIARVASGQDGVAVARLTAVVEEEINRLRRIQEGRRRNGRRARRNGRQTTSLRPARVARGR